MFENPGRLGTAKNESSELEKNRSTITLLKVGNIYRLVGQFYMDSTRFTTILLVNFRVLRKRRIHDTIIFGYFYLNYEMSSKLMNFPKGLCQPMGISLIALVQLTATHVYGFARHNLPGASSICCWYCLITLPDILIAYILMIF